MNMQLKLSTLVNHQLFDKAKKEHDKLKVCTVYLLIHIELLEVLEGPEADGRFWNTAVQQYGQAAVKSPDTALIDGLATAVHDPLILSRLRQ